MARAKFRTKKEISKLVRVLAPLPQVPDRIEPLGPEPRKAMRLLVAALEKRRFAVGARPRKPPRQRGGDSPASEATETQPPRGSDACNGEVPPADGADRAQRNQPTPISDSGDRPRQQSRHIPAAEKRAVFERDGGRCSYVDGRGLRCLQTHCLEIHHVQPFAKGGANAAQDLALRCAAHNALAAEEDFGREVMLQKRDTHHESRRRSGS
jgi:hypothetical protein